MPGPRADGAHTGAAALPRSRQSEIAEKFANVTDAMRKHHQKNRPNGTRRPKSLPGRPGVLWLPRRPLPASLRFAALRCAALRCADRFACSKHIIKGACSNSRTIPHEDLEARVRSGLKDRMMAPEIVEEATRAHAEETNQLNRERRSSGDAWKAEPGSGPIDYGVVR